MDTMALARMESLLDFYETELDQLNELLIRCGFINGISTLKETALDLLKDDAALEG